MDVKIASISQNTTCLVNETKQIELICNATGNPITTLVWTHNDQVLASSTHESNLITNKQNFDNVIDGKRIVEKIESKFMFENHQSNSMQIKLIIEKCLIGEEQFNCIAFNQFSKDEQSVSVTGYLKPTFLISPNETHKSLNENSSITIDCNVNGYPEPTIIWLKVYFLLPYFWLHCSLRESK